MERNDQDELLREMLVIETMVKENPCRMKKGLISSLTDVVRSFIGQHCIEGATREQVAKYLGRDVRSLSHYKAKYKDFPDTITNFAHNKTYNWIDIIGWKLKHKDIFEKQKCD